MSGAADTGGGGMSTLGGGAMTVDPYGSTGSTTGGLGFGGGGGLGGLSGMMGGGGKGGSNNSAQYARLVASLLQQPHAGFGGSFVGGPGAQGGTTQPLDFWVKPTSVQESPAVRLAYMLRAM